MLPSEDWTLFPTGRCFPVRPSTACASIDDDGQYRHNSSVHLLKNSFQRGVYQTPRGGASHHHVTYTSGRRKLRTSALNASGASRLQAWPTPGKITSFDAGILACRFSATSSGERWSASP